MGYPDLPVFLGVGRYRGTWNATTNSGTLAGPEPTPGHDGVLAPLFPTGSTERPGGSAAGGYHGGTNLTATIGDFWKVTTAGSTPVDNEEAWRVSDFVVFTYNSGSTSGSIWQKLSYTDTISSVIMGNGSGGSTKFGVSAADVHEFSGSVYVSGNIYAEELNTTIHNHTIVTSIIEKSGSTTFGNTAGDTHVFSGSVYTGGNLAVGGTYASHTLTVHGDSSVIGGIETAGNLSVSGSTTFGDASTDNHQVTGTLTTEGYLAVNNRYATHALTVAGDISGSARAMIYGGIETHGALGVTGSMTVRGSAYLLGGIAGTLTVGDTLTVSGDISGSGKILNVGGIETQGDLGVTGSTTLRSPASLLDNLDVSGTITAHGVGATPAMRFTGSQNTDFKIYQTISHLGFYDVNKSAYTLGLNNNKLAVGQLSPSHTLTVAGDISGSGKILNVGGIETQGDLGVTGSVIVRGSLHAYGALQSTADSYVSTQLAVGAAMIPTHTLTVAGDISGSGKIFNVGGIETQGELLVTGSIISRHNIVASSSVSLPGGGIIEMSSSAQNSHYALVHAARSMTLYNYNASNYVYRVQDQKINFGNANIPTHTVTIAGDMSGSGKIFNVGGIETQGDLGVTGSVYVRHNISGSGKIFNIGGIETQGSLGVSGSTILGDETYGRHHQVIGALSVTGSTRITTDLGIGPAATHKLTVGGDISGSGKIFNIGGIETAGNLGVTGSTTFEGVATHEAHDVFNVGITIKNADASAGYINFYEQSSNGTNVCTFRGKSSMGNCTITLPGDTGTVVLEDNTVTLSNKTIASPIITGDLSGSGKIFNEGGIETAGNLGVSGSTVFGDESTDSHQFTGSVYVSGTLVANEYRVVTFDYRNGSTVFGNSADDRHYFTGSLGIKGNVEPGTDNTYNLGAANMRWANIYTGDLHLKNDKGDWTILEEEEYLCVINNKTNKKYKMMLQEIED